MGLRSGLVLLGCAALLACNAIVGVVEVVENTDDGSGASGTTVAAQTSSATTGAVSSASAGGGGSGGDGGQAPGCIVNGGQVVGHYVAADVAASGLLDGDPVLVWPDRTGVYDLQALDTQSAPVLSTDRWSHPAIHFEGSTDGWSGNAYRLPDGEPDAVEFGGENPTATFAFVVRANDAFDERHLFLYGNLAQHEALFVVRTFELIEWTFSLDYGGVDYCNDCVQLGVCAPLCDPCPACPRWYTLKSPGVGTQWQAIIAVKGPSHIAFYENGARKADANGILPVKMRSTNLRIGVGNEAGFWNGDVAEIAFLRQALDDAEALSLSQCWGAQYGFPVN
jgi:hypothetical protein